MRPLRLSIFLPLLLFIGVAQAAPKSQPWPRWQVHDSHSTANIDYSAWTAFLQKYVVNSKDGINRVRYGAVSADDRKALTHFIDTLEGVKIDHYSRARQRPYWTNLYNAETVNLVLQHYPIKSIRDIDLGHGLSGFVGGLFSAGPWDAKVLKVEGVALSLNDIEHRILRPIWKQDPRTHYSVNCASLGCPNLRREAYTAQNMQQMLDAAARDYINNPRGAKVSDGKLSVSSLYIWYQSDFGGNDAGVIAQLKKYADPKLKKQLEGITTISSHHYDWALNAAPADTPADSN